MNAQQRRAAILTTLQGADGPISATTLAQRLGVSRQVIVGDIALIRAAGTDICATPRGYVILRTAPGIQHRVACRHSREQMGLELHAMVEAGCTVLDVIVEHPIYGQITGPLQLATHADVDQFLRRCELADAQPLSLLTEGLHLHTLSCPSEAVFGKLLETLRTQGIIFAE